MEEKKTPPPSPDGDNHSRDLDPISIKEGIWIRECIQTLPEANVPAWKSLERKTAEQLRGERIIRENFSDHDIDVEHPLFAVDCKSRKTMAVWSWFKKLEKDIKEIARHKDKVPMLVLKEKGKHGELAVLRLNDLLKLLKGEM